MVKIKWFLVFGGLFAAATVHARKEDDRLYYAFCEKTLLTLKESKVTEYPNKVKMEERECTSRWAVVTNPVFTQCRVLFEFGKGDSIDDVPATVKRYECAKDHKKKDIVVCTDKARTDPATQHFFQVAADSCRETFKNPPKIKPKLKRKPRLAGWGPSVEDNRPKPSAGSLQPASSGKTAQEIHDEIEERKQGGP